VTRESSAETRVRQLAFLLPQTQDAVYIRPRCDYEHHDMRHGLPLYLRALYPLSLPPGGHSRPSASRATDCLLPALLASTTMSA
jgi:hypothetical protein